MKLIVACDKNGGIGYNNQLPWKKIEGDLPRFKRLTEGNVVVMGRKTWASLNYKPLPNRIHFIVTSDLGLYPSCCFTIRNLDYLKGFKNAWLIGGSKLIETNWDRINEIYLTQTFAEYECDRFIDLDYIRKNFKIKSASGHGDHNYGVLIRDV